jgi:serine/threonine-protein kinase RsbW
MADSSTPNRSKELQMMLQAKAENVPVVRHALAGLAEEIGMEGVCIADLKTVVTEACMNVVVHAYPGKQGLLGIEAEPEADGLTVVVRDTGVGIRPQADGGQAGLRLGLSLIAALSSSFTISSELNGTEITMRLPLRAGGSDDDGAPIAAELNAPTETEIVVRRSELLGPVLGRVIAALAARQDLSIDRVSDAVLVTDAIAAAAPSRFVDGSVRLELEDREAGIELRLGPMVDGGAERVREALEVPQLGGSLEALADELSVEESAGGDYLVIGFAAV